MEPLQRSVNGLGGSQAGEDGRCILYYAQVLNQWRMKKWSGIDDRRFLYEKRDFTQTFRMLQDRDRDDCF